MPRRIIAGLVVLVLVVAGIIWLVTSNQNEDLVPVLSATAENQTKNASATSVTANPNDVIVFTLKADNQNDEVIEGYIMEVSLADITSNASLIDASGASYNSGTNSLVWTPLDIPANESIQKQFTVRVNPLSSASATAQLKVRFNNEIVVQISGSTVAGGQTPPPTPGYVAPTSGPSNLVVWILAILSTSLFAFRKKLSVLR